MNCIDPPALSALDLAIYLDGEADAATVHHIAACPSCRAKAVAQAQQQNQLADLLYRSHCPTPEELRDYAMGLLNRTDHSNVALHLARCPYCTRELFVLNDFLAAEAVTPHPLAQLVFHVATLLNGAVTNGATPLLAGQRGAEPALRLYQAGAYQIGLELVEDITTGQKHLQGIITGGELDNLLVHLWHNDQLVATVPVDPLLGDFQILNVPTLANDSDLESSFELIVSAPQVKVRIPALQLDV